MTGIVDVHGILNYRYFRSAPSLMAAGEAISLDWTSWLKPGMASAGLCDAAAQELLIEWVEQMQAARRAAQGPRPVRRPGPREPAGSAAGATRAMRAISQRCAHSKDQRETLSRPKNGSRASRTDHGRW